MVSHLANLATVTLKAAGSRSSFPLMPRWTTAGTSTVFYYGIGMQTTGTNTMFGGGFARLQLPPLPIPRPSATGVVVTPGAGVWQFGFAVQVTGGNNLGGGNRSHVSVLVLN